MIGPKVRGLLILCEPDGVAVVFSDAPVTDRMAEDVKKVSRVAFLCDANLVSGAGHLSRCLALGEAIVDLGAYAVIVGDVDARFRRFFDDSGVDLVIVGSPWGEEGLEQRLCVLDDEGATHVVIDSYEARPSDAHEISRSRLTAVIDDFARWDDYPCHVVINFTIGAPDMDYPSGPGLYLGPSWFLARRPLRRLRAAIESIEPDRDIHRVLVALGGSGLDQPLGMVAGLIDQVVPDAGIRVISSIKSGEQLLPTIQTKESSFHLTHVDLESNLASQLRWADLVVSGGGLTKYESAYVGRPTVVLNMTPDQQLETLSFAGLDLALDGGTLDDLREGHVEPLTQSLQRIVQEPDIRRLLVESGHNMFPNDPTIDVARELLSTKAH